MTSDDAPSAATNPSPSGSLGRHLTRPPVLAAVLLLVSGSMLAETLLLPARSGEVIARHRLADLTAASAGERRRARSFELRLPLDVAMDTVAIDLEVEAGVPLPAIAVRLETPDHVQLQPRPGGARRGPTGATHTDLFSGIATGVHRIFGPLPSDPEHTTLQVRARVRSAPVWWSFTGALIGMAGCGMVIVSLTRWAHRQRRRAEIAANADRTDAPPRVDADG